MEYVSLLDIAEEVKQKLTASGLFSEVRRAAITGAENLFAAVPELSVFPVAIVNTPPQSFPVPGAWRDLALEIIIVDEFVPLDMEAKAESACRLLDGVVQALTPTQPGQSLRLDCGANLLLEDVMALAVDSQHTAWLVETRVKSPIKK